MATPGQLRTEGASRSLNKTIRELEDILAGNCVRPTGKMRRALHRLMRDYGEHWLRLGFARGIEELRKRSPKAVGKLLPIRTRRKVWLAGRRSRVFRRIELRHK